MKKQKSRELLLITKAVEKWDEAFNENVDALMDIMNKIDNEKQTERTIELMDVYNKKHTRLKKLKRKTSEKENRPFEFIVNCN